MFDLRRREFIILAGGALAWPLAARAQQRERMRRIGMLLPFVEDDPEAQLRVNALRQTLRELGWAEGQNFSIDYRWTGNNPGHMRSYAKELVGLTPDVIVVNSTLVLAALKNETKTVPIVFVQVPDPVEAGFVESLARPGGNITGFTNFEYAMAGKWLDLLKDIVPHLAQAMVIQNPGDWASSAYARQIATLAPSIGVQLSTPDVHDATELEHALGTLAHNSNAGLIVLPGIFTLANREPIVGLAAQYRLPAVYPYKYFITAGGLISYGVDTVDLYRRAAGYVDRILKGAVVGNLPVQAPVKFELVINRKTTKQLGVELPLHLQQLADQVIE
jgi:putative tryptophan/tyrosine transport system substrate-binding protein